ncbi:ABC transporter substrate-binding protein [Pseudochelatococcus lubricantis]|uniref:ABC transporter substrate-binding protein n=1 Tax=Pseudochelatococcus lubricantis TaxID=1538102 RepID=UPI0035EC5F08
MTISRRRFNRLLLATSLAGFGLFRPGPGQARSDVPIRGGTLKWAYTLEPGSALFAINTSSGTGQAIGPKVVEGLFTFDYDLNPVPLLATDWSVSGDGLRYTFKLRQGVRWHDGKDFTSADVAFSIFRLKEAHPRGSITYQNLVAVETPDPHTAIVVLSKPAPYLITALSSSESPIVPKHVFEALPLQQGQTLATAIGTGPFKLVEWVPGSHLIFDRNPDYWDEGKPYLDRLVLRIITDPAARAAALETGEVDIGANPVALTDLGRLKQNPDLVVDEKIYAYAGQQQQLFFNFDRDIWKDRRVRLAVAKSIDLKAFVDVVTYGTGLVSPSPIAVTLSKFHDAGIRQHPFDPAAAERLLDEAGYPRGAKGFRFPVRLLYNTFLAPNYADFISNALRTVGIEAEIVRLDLPTYLRTVYGERNFDLTIESLSNLFDPTLGVQRAYWSRNIKKGVPFSNAAGYSNPEVDALLEAAAIEVDEAKRRELWVRFQNIIHDEAASVDLIVPGSQIVANRKVKNFVTGGQGINWSFGDIWIDPGA